MKLLIWILIFIALFLLWIYVFQRSIIYLPDKSKPVLEKLGISKMQEIFLTTEDGLTLLSWYQPAHKGQPTILYFQGNAGNIGSRQQLILPYLKKGYGVLLLGYRGYGDNPGEPSEQGLYKDMWAGWNFLRKTGVPTKCIVLLGESLGSGLAIELAKHQQVGALVLLAPYTSMTDLGYHHYPFLPVSAMLKDRFDSIEKISSIKVPLLILAAENDSVVPAKFSKRLYEAASQPKSLVIYNNAEHNHLPTMVQEKVINFLNKWQVCKN